MDRTGQERLERHGQRGGQEYASAARRGLSPRRPPGPRSPPRRRGRGRRRARRPPPRASRPSGRRVRKLTAAAAARDASATPLGAGIGHARRLEGRHLRRAERAPPVTSGSASAAPLPSPSRRPRSSRGRSAELGEHERVPGLRRAMRGDHASAASGASRAATSAAAPVTNPSRSRTRRRRAPPRHTPARKAISKPPSAARTPTGSRGSGSLTLERAADGSDLAREALVVDARAAPADSLGRGRQQRRAERGGRGRVADAHVAEAQDREARSRQLARRARRRPSSPASACSRVIAGPSVASAVPAPSRSARTPGTCTGSSDAGVDDDETCADLAGEHVDRGTACSEVGEHLPRDLLGIRAHALGGDAVVTGRRPRAQLAAGRARRRPGSRRCGRRAASSSPRLPRGFVLRSSASWAAAAAAASTGRISSRTCSMSHRRTAAIVAARAPGPRRRGTPAPPPRRRGRSRARARRGTCGRAASPGTIAHPDLVAHDDASARCARQPERPRGPPRARRPRCSSRPRARCAVQSERQSTTRNASPGATSERAGEVERLLDRRPAGRPLGAVARDARGHPRRRAPAPVATKTTGRSSALAMRTASADLPLRAPPRRRTQRHQARSEPLLGARARDRSGTTAILPSPSATIRTEAP